MLLIAVLASANLLVLALSGYSLHESRQEYLQQARSLSQNVAMALDQKFASTKAARVLGWYAECPTVLEEIKQGGYS